MRRRLERSRRHHFRITAELDGEAGTEAVIGDGRAARPVLRPLGVDARLPVSGREGGVEPIPSMKTSPIRSRRSPSLALP